MRRDDLNRKWMARASAFFNALQGEYEERNDTEEMFYVWAQQSKRIVDQLIKNLPPEPLEIGQFRVWVYLSDQDEKVREIARVFGGVSIGFEENQEIFLFPVRCYAMNFQNEVLYTLNRIAVMEVKS